MTGFGAVVGGLILGVPRLQAYAIEKARDAEVEVRFVNEPAWVNDGLRQLLHATALAQLDDHIHERSDLIDIRDALEDTGWFESVDQVQRAGRHRIVINAQFAHPHALIRERSEQLDYLIDVKGRVLPHAFAVDTAAVEYPVIVGVSQSRPSRTGDVWKGADVVAALALLREIMGEPWRSQIAEIDVSNYLRTQQIELVTDRDCRIIWGRAPGDVSMGEITTEEKLANLRHLYDNDGRLDVGCSGGELILYGATTNLR